jgi:hypothetical protein
MPLGMGLALLPVKARKLRKMLGANILANSAPAVRLPTPNNPIHKENIMHTINHIRAVDANQVPAPKGRLAKVLAAKQDPVKKTAFDNAVRGLRRLGFEIEAIAASGSIAELDRVMAEKKWTSTERISLKHSLAIVGAIE